MWPRKSAPVDTTAASKHTDIGYEPERREILRVMHLLDEGEKVLIVATQSRYLPGGSVITTPNTVFATDKKLIIRNPTMLGLRESVEYFPYKKITYAKLEQGRFSSTIVITAPGMGTAARLSRSSGLGAYGRQEDGMIDAIPTAKAVEILSLIRKRSNL